MHILKGKQLKSEGLLEIHKQTECLKVIIAKSKCYFSTRKIQTI
jgi:hypothetical protein